MRFNKESTLSLKDTSKAFPMRTPLGVLKWRYASADENDLPISGMLINMYYLFINRNN